MIGVRNQYRYQFSIGDLKDFIQEGEIQKFTVIEEAGNILPTFELTFQFENEKLIEQVNEGNLLNVIYGPDNEMDEIQETSFYISKIRNKKSSSNSYIMILSGFLNSLGYVTNRKKTIITPRSGIEAIRVVAGNNFEKVDSDPMTSDDTQAWIQPNTTDRAFINEIWMHSYLENSFIALAILQNGTFRIRDVRKAASQAKGKNWAWHLVTTVEDPTKEIGIDGATVWTSNSGFINNVLGYGRTEMLHHLDEGTSEIITERAFEPFLSTGHHNRSSSIGARYGGHTMLSADNVDPHYQEAFLQNLVNLGIFSSTTLSVVAHRQYKDIAPLDVVFLSEPQIQDYITGESSVYLAGLYIVTKVTRTIEDRTTTLYLDIVRSTLNEKHGDLS